jgi:CRISPR-associated protein Csa3
MGVMVETVHYVPVGHTPQTLIESLRHYPVSKVVFLTGDKEDSEGEKKARKVLADVKTALGTTPTDSIYLDLDDIPGCALKIIEQVKKEKSKEVLFNLSGSLRSLDLACYMAALATNTKTYVGIPKYQKGKITGISEVKEIPLIPIKPYYPEKTKILQTLKTEKTLEELITILKPKLKKKTQAYLTERSRLSHHIKDLNKDRLIQTRKEGKKITIKLTALGKLYLEGTK